MRSPRLIADLDPEAPDLEGYLFPETYSFASATREREIVETLVEHLPQALRERGPAAARRRPGPHRARRS